MAAVVLPSVLTHADLAKAVLLNSIAQDLEGDTVYWRLLDVTHGTAKLSSDGQVLVFTPEPGYTGPALLRLTADDGFASSAPIELAVNVSNAQLLAIHLTSLPNMLPGQSAIVRATGDFEDEKNVDLSASGSYLTVSAVDLTAMAAVGPAAISVDDLNDGIRVVGNGPALISVSRIDTDGRLVRTVASLNVEIEEPELFIGSSPSIFEVEPDVYPGTLSLTPGSTRQLKVHLNFDSAARIDISQASPTANSGTRYYSSDESIASVSESGLITTHRTGNVTISVVHLGSELDRLGEILQQRIGQSDVLLSVQAAVLSDDDAGTAAPPRIEVAAATGGIVTSVTGETVMIGAGSLAQDTPVSVRRIDLADIQSVTGMAAPAQSVLQTIGAFKLDIGTTPTTKAVQLTIPVQSGITTVPGEEVLFFRKGKVMKPDGTLQDTWWLVDNGFMGADGIARTASIPYATIDSSGEYLVAKRLPGVIGGQFQLIMDAGTWLDFSGIALAGGPMGMLITSEMIAIVATSAAQVGAGSYYAGIPQFSTLTLPTIAPGDTYKVDVSQVLPPPKSPDGGNVTIPTVTAASYDNAAEALKFTISNDEPGEFAGTIVIRALFDDGTYRDVQTLDGSTKGEINVTPPADLAVASVRWQLVRQIPTGQVTGSGEISDSPPKEYKSSTVRITPKTGMAAALTRTGIVFLRENLPVAQTALVSTLGQPNNLNSTYLTGNKVQPIAFSGDGSRAFVGGNGVIYAIDMVTFKLLQTIPVPAGRNITSLASVGSKLYVGEGQSFGSGEGNFRLMVIDINPSSKEYNQVITLKNTGIEKSPLGIAGMAIGPDGKTLVVAVPINPNNTSLGKADKRGNVLVFDLSTLKHKVGDKTGEIAEPKTAELPGGDTAIGGKAPQTITATDNPNHFLIANVADYNYGLSTLVITRDENGKIATAKTMQIKMAQPGKIMVDRLDIQRAQSAVLVKRDGVEYAIVSDDNYNFLDPYWRAMFEAPDFLWTPSGPPIAFGGSATAKKVAVGGKLGIIKDPFGNAPLFMGATLPLDGYGIINLSLSDDGEVLLGQLKGGYGTIEQFTPKQHKTQVWSVDALIASLSAEDRTTKHLKLASGSEQLVPTSGAPAGTVFQQAPVRVSMEGRMGDVIAVDLIDLAARQLAELDMPDKLPYEKMTNEQRLKLDEQKGKIKKEFSIDSGEFDRLKLTTNELQLVAKKDAKDPLSRDIKTQLTDAKFKESGVLFFTPNISDTDVEQLRLGKTLAEKAVSFEFTFKYTNKDGNVETKVAKAFIKALDYAEAAKKFIGDRDLENPGYSTFDLLGTVGTGQKNDLLDVLRVEQRLRYLGFPAYGKDAKLGSTSTKVEEFKVDGKWGADEERALKLFEFVIHNGDTDRPSGITSRGDPMAPAPADKPHFDGKITDKAEDTKNWLNGWNAPHWVNVVESLESGTVKNVQNQHTGQKEQNYGTSWMRDLLAAYKEADPFLRPAGQLMFGGATDANYSYTYWNTGYASGDTKNYKYVNTQYHDAGMGLDLAFWDPTSKSGYIDPAWQRHYGTEDKYIEDTGLSGTWNDAKAGTVLAAATPDTQLGQRAGSKLASGLWSYKPKALTWEEFINGIERDGRSITNKINNQRAVAGQLLTLYSITKADSLSSILLGAKLEGSTKAATALFGGLIDSVVIGSKYGTFNENQARTNNYQAIRNALQSAGMKATAAELDVQDHAYLKFVAPKIRAIDKPPAALMAGQAGESGAFSTVDVAAIGLALADAGVLQWGSAASTWNTVLANLKVEALPGQQLAETYDGAITIDPTAAGNGWFLDVTPNDNDEFLPTANPNEWIAKAGSAAEGRMDMLSVLLHEYGHVLGLDHSTDAHDAMAATLQPGMRRLPSIEDMALMAQLIGELKNAIILGESANTQNPSVVTTSNTASGPSTANGPQALVVPNATLLDGDLQNAQGWSTAGSVQIGNGQAVLSEATGTQAALRQTFVLGDQYRFLSFTLRSAQFGERGGPQDAFEVGLLSPTDGHVLTSVIGLTHTDALLNIQADGTERTAQGVARIVNADGSRTYTIDLRSLAGGTEISLSFDLIGFGVADSQMVVSDVRLLGAVQAVDDEVSMSEDAPAVINALGNDSEAQQAGFAPVVVTGPAHGVVTVNADGTFLYEPAANYYGADSFTYKVTDGQSSSNIATVSINVTPVNDAPVASDSAAGLDEDGTAVVDLRALASDIDSASVTPQIVTGPAHGSLIVNGDGSYTYTADANFFGEDSFTYRVNDDELDSNTATVTLTVAAVNDAPVARNGAANLDEDDTIVLDLRTLGMDIDSTTLTASIVSGPAHGVLTANADGTFSYAPNLNFNGTDSFSYLVNDGGLDSNIATVTFTVAAVNDAPATLDGAVTTAEDTPVTINLLALASDIDSTTLTPQIIGGPVHGTLIFNGDGSYTYTADVNYFGTDSFTYRVNDDELDSNISTVTLTVTAVNDAPVAKNGAVTLEEDNAIVVDLRSLATDVDSATLTPQIIGGPIHGSLTVNSDGTFTYTADADYFGADSFTYRVNDGELDSNIATVSLTVTPANDAPVAADGAASLNEDGTVNLDLRTLAIDIDSASLTASIVNGPAHGVLTANADGTFSYAPNLNFNGTDSFSYLVNDGGLDSNIATVTLTVAAVNDAPVVTATSVTTAEDTPVLISLLALASDVDSSTLTPQIIGGPVHGSLTVNSDGTFTYTADANYFGADSFTYRVNDGELDSSIATVSLTVTPVNDAPVAADGAASLNEDGTVNLDLRTLAIDIDSASLTASIVNGPAHGVLTANADGTFTYAPNLNFNGTDSFSYLVNDGGLDSNIATVTLTVAAVNDAPVVTATSVTTAEDTPVLISLLALASDVDSSTLTPQIIGGPVHGSLTVNSDGTFTYTADANYFGADSFTYRVNDGELDSNIATVSLTVTPVNDAPVAADGAASLNEDGFVNLDLRTLAIDIDSATLTASIISGPANGVLTANADGTFSYAPNLNFNGTDSFSYLVNDGGLDSNIATVTLTVAAVNDAPVTAGDTADIQEDHPIPVSGNVLVNDSDVDTGTVLTVAVPGNYAGAYGTLTLSADGSYSYALDNNSAIVQALRAGEVVTDVFTYAATDGVASTASQLTIVVTGLNDGAVTVADDANVSEDNTLSASGNVLFNDSDVDTDTVLTVVAPGTYVGAYGTLILSEDGSYSYVLANDSVAVQALRAGEVVVDTFNYAATDGLTSTPSKLAIAIAGQNDAPVTTNDAASVAEDGMLFATGNLLSNDSDVDTGTVLTVAGPGTYAGTYGTLTMYQNGSYFYTLGNSSGIVQALREGEVVTDVFAYAATDGITSTPANLTVSITGKNDAPIVTGDAAFVTEDGTLIANGNLLINDRDIDRQAVLTVATAGTYQGIYGSLTVSTNGDFTYVLDNSAARVQALRASEIVVDYFDYATSDGLASTPGQVAVVVTGRNDAPVTAVDTASVAEDGALMASGNVLSNDSDVDTDTVLTVAAPGTYAGIYGTLVLSADGSYTYTLANDAANVQALRAGEVVQDVFAYAATDRFVSTPSTLTIVITGQNDAAVTGNDTASVAEDTALLAAGNVLANDSDVDTGTVLSVAAPGAYVGTYGTLSLAADGSYSYTLANESAIVQALRAGEVVTDTFFYAATDGMASTSAQLVVAITGRNDGPVVQADTAAVDEDGITIVGGIVLSNDSDVDTGTVLTVAAPGTYAGIYGSLSLAADGSYTYTLANDSAIVQALRAGEAVTDVFAYAATDGIASTPSQLTIVVTGKNDAPVTANDSASVDEDGVLIASGNLLSNDSDVDTGAVLTVAGPGSYAGTYGTLTVAADGAYTYALANNAIVVQSLLAGQVVTDAFDYAATDGITSTSATLTMTITGQNDGPVAYADTGSAIEDGSAVTLTAGALLANDADTDAGDTKAIVAVTNSAAGAQVRLVNGDVVYDIGNLFQSLAAGEQVTDIFTYTMSDGQGATSTTSVTMTVTGVNDVPRAVASSVTGTEDTPYVFSWSDFSASDVDHGAVLSVVVGSLPLDGVLQYFKGSVWSPVAAGQVIAKTDVDAGRLRFGADPHESGFDGYANAGVGNGKQDYASFMYAVTDGMATSAAVSMTLDIAPVADAPTLSLGNPSDAYGATAERFSTSWETVANRNANSTVLPQAALEGWHAVMPAGDNNNHFVVWSTGDQMADADNKKRTVTAATGNGSNWIELGNSQGKGHETYGIERTVDTRAGVSYSLSFDYAGRLGFSEAYTKIGIYVDGTLIATFAGISPNTALDWQALSFEFVGTGGTQTIRIQSEATASQSNGRGAMIDDIVLTERLAINTGYQDSPIRLSTVVPGLVDTDGSETLSVAIGAIPAGAVLTDGTYSFTATAGNTTATVTGWNLATLSITAPTGFTGDFVLTVTATATEAATNQTATTSRPLTVTVLSTSVTGPVAPAQPTVAPANQAPQARPKLVGLEQGGTVLIDLRSLASDADTDCLSFCVVQPAHGRLVKQAEGLYTYTPDRAYAGPDAFVYIVSDGRLSTAANISLVVRSSQQEQDACERDERHSSKINVQSVLPATSSVNYGRTNANAGTNKNAKRADATPPVVDWSKVTTSANLRKDDDSDAPTTAVSGHWLAEFLGTTDVPSRDVSKLTGLKVTLGETPTSKRN